MASVPQPTLGAARQELYRRMHKDNLAPLWEVLHELIPNEPATACLPALWKYRQARPYLMEAGKLITAREAIRRVLILENPGMRGDSIITHSWTWHDHGNPGSEPVVWMDGLDIRIVQLFAAQFHEVYPEEVQPVSRSEGASAARYGNNLMPLAAAAPFGKTSPIFNYPYARSRDSLDKLSQDQAPDPCHGWKMQFMNPLTGGHAMPTIAPFIQLLPKGFRSQAYRSTDGTIYSVVEGEGRVRIGDEAFEYEARDTFVAPSWAPLRFEAKGATVLFSFSDRPGQEAMGLWREKRG